MRNYLLVLALFAVANLGFAPGNDEKSARTPPAANAAIGPESVQQVDSTKQVEVTQMSIRFFGHF